MPGEDGGEGGESRKSAPAYCWSETAIFRTKRTGLTKSVNFQLIDLKGKFQRNRQNLQQKDGCPLGVRAARQG